MKKYTKKAFACGVDWQHELGEAPGGVPLYASVKDIKHHRSCTKECGIVRLNVSVDRWVLKQNLLSDAHETSEAQRRRESIQFLLNMIGWKIGEFSPSERRRVEKGLARRLSKAINEQDMCRRARGETR